MASGRGHPASGTLSSPSRTRGCFPPPFSPGSAIAACPAMTQGEDGFLCHSFVAIYLQIDGGEATFYECVCTYQVAPDPMMSLVPGVNVRTRRTWRRFEVCNELGNSSPFNVRNPWFLLIAIPPSTHSLCSASAVLPVLLAKRYLNGSYPELGREGSQSSLLLLCCCFLDSLALCTRRVCYFVDRDTCSADSPT